MDQKYGEFVGVDSVYTADVITDDTGSYISGTPEYLAPVAEIAGEPEVNTQTTYYDNKAANNYVTEGMTSLAVTVSNIPAQLLANLLGKHYDVATGRVLDTGEANPPDKAIGFRYNMGKNGYRYYWYLKGTFSGGAEEAASKTNDVDAKTYELTYTAVTTTHEWDINGEDKSLKRVFGDTANPTFNPAGWFDQVQTPDTASAPADLTLSTAPEDNASGVAVDSSIVLTFNNKIASYSVVVVNELFDTIATTNSFDATGKILTINPDSNLAAATSYAVVVTNIKDIYGKTLADRVINFTTA